MKPFIVICSAIAGVLLLLLCVRMCQRIPADSVPTASKVDLNINMAHQVQPHTVSGPNGVQTSSTEEETEDGEEDIELSDDRLQKWVEAFSQDAPPSTSLFAEIGDAMLAEQGLPPSVYPNRHRVDALTEFMHDHGYSRDELWGQYRNSLLDYVVVDPFDRNVPKTQQLITWFNAGERERIEAWAAQRLRENPADVPALLVQFDLQQSQYEFDKFYDIIEILLPALEAYEGAVDKRAIMYYVIDFGEMWGYQTDVSIEDQKLRHGDRLLLTSFFILTPLEEAGDW